MCTADYCMYEYCVGNVLAVLAVLSVAYDENERRVLCCAVL